MSSVHSKSLTTICHRWMIIGFEITTLKSPLEALLNLFSPAQSEFIPINISL